MNRHVAGKEFCISTDSEQLDLDMIYGFLSQAYWSKQRSKKTVEQSLKHSLNFGIYLADRQVGLARVITDFTVYAYLADVFVLEEFRGLGLGKWLIQSILEFPDLQGLGKWQLTTQDAHSLYEQFGFEVSKRPEWIMERS